MGIEAAVSDAMTSDEILRDKLRKIESLIAGAAATGEKPPPKQPQNGSANGLGKRRAKRNRSS